MPLLFYSSAACSFLPQYFKARGPTFDVGKTYRGKMLVLVGAFRDCFWNKISSFDLDELKRSRYCLSDKVMQFVNVVPYCQM